MHDGQLGQQDRKGWSSVRGVQPVQEWWGWVGKTAPFWATTASLRLFLLDGYRTKGHGGQKLKGAVVLLQRGALLKGTIVLIY